MKLPKICQWLAFLISVLLLESLSFGQTRLDFSCEDPFSLCTERHDNQSADPDYLGQYIGHDEPALLFYSDVPGSGNFVRFKMILPKDPPVFPTDAHSDGSGEPTVWNFQLHPAFWAGMALCDTESYPLATHDCKADSDDNIFDDPDPNSERYIGKHPGASFLELQFYLLGGLWVSLPLSMPPRFTSMRIFKRR